MHHLLHTTRVSTHTPPSLHYPYARTSRRLTFRNSALSTPHRTTPSSQQRGLAVILLVRQVRPHSLTHRLTPHHTPHRTTPHHTTRHGVVPKMESTVGAIRRYQERIKCGEGVHYMRTAWGRYAYPQDQPSTRWLPPSTGSPPSTFGWMRQPRRIRGRISRGCRGTRTPTFPRCGDHC